MLELEAHAEAELREKALLQQQLDRLGSELDDLHAGFQQGDGWKSFDFREQARPIFIPQFKYPGSKSVLYTLHSVKKSHIHSIMYQKVFYMECI